MNCTNCQEQLAAYCEGLLDPATAAETHEHLAGCDACRGEQQAIERLRACLWRQAWRSEVAVKAQ